MRRATLPVRLETVRARVSAQVRQPGLPRERAVNPVCPVVQTRLEAGGQNGNATRRNATERKASTSDSAVRMKR